MGLEFPKNAFLASANFWVFNLARKLQCVWFHVKTQKIDGFQTHHLEVGFINFLFGFNLVTLPLDLYFKNKNSFGVIDKNISIFSIPNTGMGTFDAINSKIHVPKNGFFFFPEICFRKTDTIGFECDGWERHFFLWPMEKFLS